MDSSFFMQKVKFFSKKCLFFRIRVCRQSDIWCLIHLVDSIVKSRFDIKKSIIELEREVVYD